MPGNVTAIGTWTSTSASQPISRQEVTVPSTAAATSRARSHAACAPSTARSAAASAARSAAASARCRAITAAPRCSPTRNTVMITDTPAAAQTVALPRSRALCW
jgi:hypothetical protein